MFLSLQPSIIILLLLGVVLLVNAQNYGRNKSSPSPSPSPSTTKPKTQTDGRYRPAGDGKYRPINDGRYRGGNDGKYVHKDVKYLHDARDGGLYTGDNIKYKPDKNRSGPDGPAGGGSGRDGTDGFNGGAGARAGGAGTLPPPKSNANNSNAEKSKSDNSNAVTAAPLAKPSVKGKGTGEGGNGWAIIRSENKIGPDNYRFLYETENGILAEEAGKIDTLETNDGLRSKGFYEYTGDDGLLYRVNYVADDNGFVPQGEHIPTAPPHVAKLLAYLEANAKNK